VKLTILTEFGIPDICERILSQPALR